jgi:hypothetical protein
VLLKLFRVCPETTRDRLWTARTGFFVLYPVFKEHLETRGLPAHASHAGRILMEAVVPSTRHRGSIRSDLPLGGCSRLGGSAAPSRATPLPVSRETLSI